MIVYLDLDNTLFNLEGVEALWAYVESRYPEAEGAYANHEQYHQQVGELAYYDLTAHLTALGLDPEFIYEELAASELADGTYQYDGAAELVTSLQALGFEVRVLTFGEDGYQRAKASLCPALRGIQVITTRRPKAEVLEDLEEGCWLVDDRPIGNELPNNVSFVQVVLNDKPVPSYTDWTVKRSLSEVKDFFDAIMH